LLTAESSKAKPSSTSVNSKPVIQLDPIWDELYPAEQTRIVQLLVELVVVNPNGITVRFRSDGLNTFAAKLETDEETANE